MKKKTSLSLKVTASMVLLVTVALVSVMAVVSLVIHQRFNDVQTRQNLQIAEARADQLGELFQVVEWQLRLAVDLPGFHTGDRAQSEKTVAALDKKLSPQVLQLVWSDTTGQYITSAGARGSIADRSYFKAVVLEKKDWFVSEAIVSKSLGIPIVVIATPVKDPSGATIGLLGAMIGLKELSSIASDIKSGDTGYGWVADSTGLILAHPNADAVMKLNVTDADKDGFRGLDALGKSMISGKVGFGEFVKPDGHAYTTYFSPIPGSPGWTLGLSLTSEELARTESLILTTLLIILVLAILLSVVLSLLLGRQLSRPLRLASAAFQALAEGDADLTKEIPVQSTDEVGQLIGEFNRFLAKLRTLVGGVKELQGSLRGVSLDLNRSSEALTQTSGDVSGRVSDIQGSSQGLAANVQESSSAVEEVAKNIESLDQMIVSQSASLSQASASVEEMVSTIKSIRNSAEKMTQQFQQLVAFADQGHSTHGVAMTKIQAIAEQSESLLEANHIIANIASQTNLLAMNAAIEAAHAGHAGRGFSVVADEIRKLAETSANQSRAIGKDLKDVQQAIGEAREASVHSEQSFDLIKAKASETDIIVRGVFHALEEQQEGSTQILEALREMNHVSSEVRHGSHEMKQGNDLILGEIGQVRTGASEILTSVRSVGEEMGKIAEAAATLKRLVGHTTEIVDSMEGHVGKFRV